MQTRSYFQDWIIFSLSCHSWVPLLIQAGLPSCLNMVVLRTSAIEAWTISLDANKSPRVPFGEYSVSILDIRALDESKI